MPSDLFAALIAVVGFVTCLTWLRNSQRAYADMDIRKRWIRFLMAAVILWLAVVYALVALPLNIIDDPAFLTAYARPALFALMVVILAYGYLEH